MRGPRLARKHKPAWEEMSEEYGSQGRFDGSGKVCVGPEDQMQSGEVNVNWRKPWTGSVSEQMVIIWSEWEWEESKCGLAVLDYTDLQSQGAELDRTCQSQGSTAPARGYFWK